MSKDLNLEDLEIYQLSMDLAEKNWKIIQNWDLFTKDTIGKQLMRALDSIAANLSEGIGRYSYKENKQFCYYSRGSLLETKTRLTKAHNRKLLTDVKYMNLNQAVNKIAIKLNNYIKSIGKQKSTKLLNDDQ
ncbi:four helix bundle protein [Desulfobacterota bacterium AH_259_B03_O07]|nr:four helix bundle protein [Desulfobacterota bacterium AH_259_B03_O07]